MALFTAKLDYALRALLDLALHPPDRPAQSREIAQRQAIPEAYLNQLLVVLRRAGLVRSVRGSAGGYTLGREPGALTVADVMEALHGAGYLRGSDEPAAASADQPAAWVVDRLRGRLLEQLKSEMEQVSLATLVVEVERLNDAQSVMLGL